MSVTDTIIRLTTNTKTNIVVNENKVNDTSTSLVLYGKSTLNPAKFINTNLLHILENFCGITAPNKPIEGQIWFDTSDANNKHEFGKLKINIKDVSGNINFHDIAGTVMDIDGHLRHIGQIEAVDEYNTVPQTNKDVYPESSTYRRFLTTKKHCDENYLSGWYSVDGSTFNVRGDRKIKTQVVQTYTAPGTYDDDRFKLINKQYLDLKFLSGQNYSDHFIIASAAKKLYYTVECQIDLPYQLITKKYVSDQDTAARAILDNLMSSSTDGLEDFVVAAEAAAEAAKTAADEAWAALNTVSSQTATSTFTFTSPSTGSTTGTITMMDVSIPTVNPYTGINTHPTVTGLLSTESALGASTTFTITIDGVAVPAANITTAAVASGFGYSIDTTYLPWVASTTPHDVVVTRYEDATHSFVSTSHDQILITSLIIPTVNAQTVSTLATSCTITGTIGTSAFDAVPLEDSIKVVFNNLTYYRYNDTNPNDSAALTVSQTGEWTLANVPTPPVGQWDVIVTRNGNPLQVDSTTNEITVAVLKDAVVPAVDKKTLTSSDNQVTNITVTGKVGSKNLTDSVSTFNVVVSSGANPPVSGVLTYDATGINWTYTIAQIDSGHIYDVTATRTDEYGNPFVDTTNGELVIQKLLDTTLPTVVSQSLTSGTAVTVTGTVGSINLTDSFSTFEVTVKDNVAPYLVETGTLSYDQTGMNWSLALTNVPGGKTYNVTATRTDQYGNTYVDNTSNELVIGKAETIIITLSSGVQIEVAGAAHGQTFTTPYSAISWASSLVAYGHNDWRCPTTTEMYAIYDQLVSTGLDTSFTTDINYSVAYRWFISSPDSTGACTLVDMRNRNHAAISGYRAPSWWVRAVRTV